MMDQHAPELPLVAALEEENRRLRVINKVLIERVEREMDPAASSAFSLFYNTVTLDSGVSHRTTTLTNLARRLVQEIAERREAEAALLEAKAAAEEANETKTNFLAAVSHDLRQPLHAARLFLGEVGESVPSGRVGALVARVESALDSMDDMLESLLDMVRLDSGAWRVDPEACALGPLLARLVAETQPQAAEAGLRLRYVDSSAAVRTDRRLLERVLRNLIGNAVQYTERGSILVGCRLRGDEVRIDVVDTGIGIPREKWQVIFQEFHQLGITNRQSGKGLGLGLAIVDRAARMLGAAVDVQSEPGRGSRFSVTLKRVQPPPMPASPAASASVAEALAQCNVLVVEDDPAVRAGMSSLLRSWQCHVVAAESTEAALAKLQANGAPPQVIIADYHLAGEDNGIRALTAVRSHYGIAIPALVMSSDRAPGLRAEAHAAGAVFLKKPVAPSKLRATLNYLLNHAVVAAE
ncbi:MAG: hybrid sensor histidine kinase/response regulator [Rhodospirillales bacterium]